MANAATRLPVRCRRCRPARIRARRRQSRERQQVERGRPARSRPAPPTRRCGRRASRRGNSRPSERRQHGRDQRRPGVDAAAEIRVEIARAQHLEAHHDRAGDEGDQIDRRPAPRAGPSGAAAATRRGSVGGWSTWILGIRGAIRPTSAETCRTCACFVAIRGTAGPGGALHLPRHCAYIWARQIGFAHAHAP